MSFESVPSKSEVLCWNSGNLADYLKKMKLLGCDRVVKKSNMSGAKFLSMTDKDLKKFPAAHIPFITKICRDINQNIKQKKTLFHRSDHRMPPNQEPNPGGWDSDEFDQDESDNDYEEPDNANEFEDNYICAASCEIEDDKDDEDDYEPPPTETPSEFPPHFRVAKPLGDGDYLDSGPRGSARPHQDKSTSLPRGLLNISKPPSRPDPSPHRPFIPPSQCKPGMPMIDRSKKPGSSTPSKKETGKSAINQVAPKSAILPAQRFNVQQRDDLPPPPVEMMGQDMDPRWYVGQMSRGEAEVSLRQMNRDGTFLVRDSSKGCTEQPYTLMMLYQQKVYNIQIRFLGNSKGYSLGTGLNGVENFSSVMDMVTHHMKTPLILIDGMERGAGLHRQCCLMHPAGF
ncbi:lymphocyte cytosolic protein 2 [Puntigrus tetrazona]|uniref:lymphocyte cytosolic protein 2 n=1 Tax=Puntigrus tetrazona TaxID=1606681 RepID=UPI001C89E9EF|nr:lymphocyte cytosolic protein 2 [Puntigrus tetrazona]